MNQVKLIFGMRYFEGGWHDLERYLMVLNNEKSNVIEKVKVVDEFENLPYIYLIEATQNEVNYLKTHEDVESLCIDEKLEFDSVVENHNFKDQGMSYALDMLEVKKFWDLGIRGKGVKIAVMDGGCQPHEDLKIAGGYNASDPDKTYMSDVRDHGTHVAGIINMQDNDIGYVGIAPEADLYIVKLDDNEGGGNKTSNQIKGINWAIENEMDIVTMSVSNLNDNDARRIAFKTAAEEHGIIVTCSVGNRTKDDDVSKENTGFPAKYPFIVGVAALNEDLTRRHTSSVGNGIDISAAGTNIVSSCIDKEKPNGVSKVYCSKSGTSMATPYIAGMFALYKQMFPNLEREELIDKMKKSAKPLGDKWQYGYGVAQFPVGDIKEVQIKERDGDSWSNIMPLTLATSVLMNDGNSLQTLFSNQLKIEKGKNENGEFIRFANGFQVCWGIPFELNATDEYNGVYRTDHPARWEFPKPFVEDSLPYISAASPLGDKWAKQTGSGNHESVPIRMYSFGEAVGEHPVHTFAVGFWK